MNVLQHTKRAKSVSQAKSTGPLLQRHSLNTQRLRSILREDGLFLSIVHIDERWVYEPHKLHIVKSFSFGS